MLTAILLAQTTPVAPPPAAPFVVTASKPLVGVRTVQMAAAPTGNRLAVALENNTIRILDAATRQTMKTLTGHPQTVGALAWSSDGKWLASGDATARIFIWDTKTWTKKYEYRPHIRGIQSLAFNPTNTALLSIAGDDTAMVFKLGDFKKEVFKVLGKGAIFYKGTYLGKTGEWAVATLNANARRMRGMNVVAGLSGHDGRGMLDLEFNPAGTRAVTAGRDNRAALYEVKTGKRLGYFKGHEDWVVRSIFTPNGRWVITSSSDRTVRVWNPFNFTEVVRVEEQSAIGSPIAVTATGSYLATVDISDNLVIHTLNPAQK